MLQERSGPNTFHLISSTNHQQSSKSICPCTKRKFIVQQKQKGRTFKNPPGTTKDAAGSPKDSPEAPQGPPDVLMRLVVYVRSAVGLAGAVGAPGGCLGSLGVPWASMEVPGVVPGRSRGSLGNPSQIPIRTQALTHKPRVASGPGGISEEYTIHIYIYTYMYTYKYTYGY